MRWLRYPIALTVVLTLAISAAMLIGRAQPLPERVALLHLNDMCKLPCWIGITPGVTTIYEARAIVQQVYSEHFAFADKCSIDFCIIDRKTQQNRFQVYFVTNFDNQTISQTDILIDGPSIESIQLNNQSPDNYIHMGDIYNSIGASDYSIYDSNGAPPNYSAYTSGSYRAETHYISYDTIIFIYSLGSLVPVPQWQIAYISIR